MCWGVELGHRPDAQSRVGLEGEAEGKRPGGSCGGPGETGWWRGPGPGGGAGGTGTSEMEQMTHESLGRAGDAGWVSGFRP